MLEWFENLSDANKIAIVVPVGIAVLAGLFGLLKLLSRKESHTGIDTEVVKDGLKVFSKFLEMIDTDQSKKFASELKDVPDEKLNAPIELLQDQNNNGRKLHLEKEFQLYGELWKALVEVKSSIIITPTLDRKQKSQSFYDLYNDRYKTAVAAFNEANQLLEYHRPFFHGDVCAITDEFLGQCRGYLFKVKKSLRSNNFNDKLHDEADELYEIIPKAIDKLERTIKIRIGLLPKPKNEVVIPIGPEIGAIVQITKGSITYQSNTLNIKALKELKTSIIGGYVKRNNLDKLESYIQTDVQVQSLQRLNEKLGLDSMRLFSESDIISVDSDNPTVFTSSTKHILPQGEMTLDLSTWEEIPLPMTFHVQTQTKASGYLEGKVFQGKFEAILTYLEVDLQVGLNGDFQVHLG